MTNDQKRGRHSLWSLSLGHLFGIGVWSVGTCLLLSGCGKPNAANISLRKENQSLKDEVARLQLQNRADQASLAVASGSTGTTRPAVDPSRLPELFTVVDLQMGRLTAMDRDSSGNPILKVQVAPRDDTGDKLKAAGTFVVEATDPSQSPEPLLQRWEFAPKDLKTLWYSTTFVYSYVLPCKWESVPKAERVRVKVSYTDLLTGRSPEPVEMVIKNAAIGQQ